MKKVLLHFSHSKTSLGEGGATRNSKKIKKIMESISSLFDITKIEKRKSKAGSERAALVEFFVDKLFPSYCVFKKMKNTPENKKKFVGLLCYKISHVKIADLYYMKSVGLEYEKRKETNEFSKYFWGSLKPK